MFQYVEIEKVSRYTTNIFLHDHVFESANSGLRCGVLLSLRSPTKEHLEDRINSVEIGVDAITKSGQNEKNALQEQVVDAVCDDVLTPGVLNAGSGAANKLSRLFKQSKYSQTAKSADVTAVKSADYLFLLDERKRVLRSLAAFCRLCH